MSGLPELLGFSRDVRETGLLETCCAFSILLGLCHAHIYEFEVQLRVRTHNNFLSGAVAIWDTIQAIVRKEAKILAY